MRRTGAIAPKQLPDTDSMRVNCLLFAILGWAVGTAPLLADTVVLANGDRLTGTVRQLSEGKLTLKSDYGYIGTLELKWADISSIETDASFSVLTVDGERHDGQLARTGQTIEVSSERGELIAIPSVSVARIARGGRGNGLGQMVDAASGSIDVGYSLARGNQNQVQSSLGSTASYSSAQYSFQGSLDSLFARQDGARSQSRHALNARLDRYVNARVFAYALSGFERNERRLLNLRSRLGGGVGWRLRQRADLSLSALGGFAYVHEDFRQLDSRVAGEAFAGVEWRRTLFKAVEVDMRLTVHNDQFNRRRVRVEYDGRLRIPIAGRFNYTLRLFDRYDTRPAESVERNDYGIVSGLGVVF